MKLKAAILFGVLAVTAAGCKGRGGGGGGWLVGSEGLMANVDTHGQLGEGYDLGQTEQLNGIACRYIAEAWVVGNGGTLLYTSDGGESWETQNLGTTANLRALATQDAGSVFVAGDGVFFVGNPEFTTGAAQWTQLGDGVTGFRALSAAQQGTTVLAVSDDGGIWSYASGSLTKITTLAGVRTIAVSPDGKLAIAAGDGVYRSSDAGRTWTPVAVDGSFHYEDVRIEESGEALAVGAGGLVSRIDTAGQVLTQRIGTADLKTVHIAPSDDYTGLGYAAGVGGQIWLTRDSGWTWEMGPNVGRTVLGADEIGIGHN
jgi:photosystem II stability/assembly factor-like uncharacterized protein